VLIMRTPARAILRQMNRRTLKRCTGCNEPTHPLSLVEHENGSAYCVPCRDLFLMPLDLRAEAKCIYCGGTGLRHDDDCPILNPRDFFKAAE